MSDIFDKIKMILTEELDLNKNGKFDIAYRNEYIGIVKMIKELDKLRSKYDKKKFLCVLKNIKEFEVNNDIENIEDLFE